jgi:hypothetical protein
MARLRVRPGEPKTGRPAKSPLGLMTWRSSDPLRCRTSTRSRCS